MLLGAEDLCGGWAAVKLVKVLVKPGSRPARSVLPLAHALSIVLVLVYGVQIYN